jgi:hypothetical protein
MKIAFYCPTAGTPAQMSGSNSKYSVQQINEGLIPWVTVHPQKWLFAGASIDEFVQFIEDAGGEIFFPKSLLQIN